MTKIIVTPKEDIAFKELATTIDEIIIQILSRQEERAREVE